CLLYSLLFFFSQFSAHPRDLHSFPTRRSSDLGRRYSCGGTYSRTDLGRKLSWHRDHHSFRRHFELSSQCAQQRRSHPRRRPGARSEEHTSELQSRFDLVCRLLLEKKKQKHKIT